MASHSRRRPLRERRTALVLAVAMAAVGVLLSLVVALRPDSEPNAVRAAAEPAATRPSTPRTTPERKPAPKPKPKPKPKPSKASPTPTAATPSARPSPTSAPRSSPRPHVRHGTAGGTYPAPGHPQGSGHPLRRRGRRRRLPVRPEPRPHGRGDEPHRLRDVQGVRGVHPGPRGERRLRHGPGHQRVPAALRPRPTRPQQRGLRQAHRPLHAAGSRSPGACSAPARPTPSRSATSPAPAATGAASRRSVTATRWPGWRSGPAADGAG